MTLSPLRFCLAGVVGLAGAVSSAAEVTLSRADYADRAQAVWSGQIVATLVGFPFEHKVATVLPVETLPMVWRGQIATYAPVDDDWFYEMGALRAFEKHGIGLTVEQLGDAWLEHGCGSYGSSEQARLNLLAGIKAPDTGHPRYNKVWFTLGPQFSADIYGALAPGRPNLAGRLAREFGHLNGYAEGTDGAVFTAAMISLGFVERDPQVIVRKAVEILDRSSPYRKSIELVIEMADAGRSFREIADAIEDRWHMEYPATNNAVANGGLVAAGLWFGRGEFWRTIDLICRAGDYTDADCNSANAGAVIGAMHGMKGLPAALVAQFNDRIQGASMGRVTFPKPVDEPLSALGPRTAAIGEKFLRAEGIRMQGDAFILPEQKIVTQPAERFVLSDLMQYWNPDWSLERAGFGGGRGGMAGNRGITCLEGDILATYPRDEIRACVLRRTVKLGEKPRLKFEAGSEKGRAWELDVYADNTLLEKHVIVGDPGARKWQTFDIDLKDFAGRETTLRLYQRVLVPNRTAGNALWKNLRVE